MEKAEVLLEGLDENNISSILKKYSEINEIRKEMDKLEEMLRVKAKNYLKERKWESYKDPETKINISITRYEQTIIDKDKLKMILSKQQIDSVSKINVIEKFMITTEESREKMKNFTRGKPNAI